MIAAVSQSQSVQQRQSKNQKSHFPTILAPVKPLIPARKHPDRGVQKFSWRLNERIIVCSVPRNDGAEGSFGCMKMESVHPGHWEERTRDEVLVPVDDCIRWYDHERIKRSLGWMSPVQYRQSQGMAA